MGARAPAAAAAVLVALVAASGLLTVQSSGPTILPTSSHGGAACEAWGGSLAVEPLVAAAASSTIVAGGLTAPGTGLPGAGRAAFLAAWGLSNGNCSGLWDILVNATGNDALVGLSIVGSRVVFLARSQSLGGIVGLVDTSDGTLLEAARIPGLEGYWGGGLGVIGGEIVVGGSRLIVALNTSGLEPLWALEAPWPIEHLAAGLEGVVLAGSSEVALVTPEGAVQWSVELDVEGSGLRPYIRGVSWLGGLVLVLAEYYEPATAEGPHAALVLIDPSVPAVAGAWRLEPLGWQSAIPALLRSNGSLALASLARQDYSEWLVVEVEPGPSLGSAYSLSGSWSPEPSDAPYTPIPLDQPGLPPIAVGPAGLEVAPAQPPAMVKVNYFLLQQASTPAPTPPPSTEPVDPAVIMRPRLFGSQGIAPKPLTIQSPPTATTGTSGTQTTGESTASTSESLTTPQSSTATSSTASQPAHATNTTTKPASTSQAGIAETEGPSSTSTTTSTPPRETAAPAPGRAGLSPPSNGSGARERLPAVASLLAGALILAGIALYKRRRIAVRG